MAATSRVNAVEASPRQGFTRGDTRAAVPSRLHTRCCRRRATRGPRRPASEPPPLVEAAVDLAATAATATAGATAETAAAGATAETAVAAASTAGAAALALTPFGTQVLQALPHVDLRICLLQAGASLFASIFGFGDAVIAYLS